LIQQADNPELGESRNMRNCALRFAFPLWLESGGSPVYCDDIAQANESVPSRQQFATDDFGFVHHLALGLGGVLIIALLGWLAVVVARRYGLSRRLTVRGESHLRVLDVRRVTQRLLERNGMRVLTARDGMDAVTLLQDNIPDVILLDIEMPRMDGYEVAAHVRNDPRLRDVPIIMITSRVGEKHRARAIELGVDDYLGKPYQEAQLLDAIAPLVERRRGPQGTGTFDRVSDARV